MMEHETAAQSRIDLSFRHSADAADEATRLHQEMIAARVRVWEADSDLHEARAAFEAAIARWKAAEARYERMYQQELRAAMRGLAEEESEQ